MIPSAVLLRTGLSGTAVRDDGQVADAFVAALAARDRGDHGLVKSVRDLPGLWGVR